MARIKDYIIATRPWSFSMSLISVLIGTLLAAEGGGISWFWFAWVLAGIVFFHAAANVFNDFYDTLYGVDQPDSPTARYRPQPLLSGMMTPTQLFVEAVVLLALTGIIGIILGVLRSPLILGIGTVGLFASIFYTAGPIKFKYRALGELAVFLMWGPLMIEGAYVVQRQAFSWKALAVSIPIGIWVALVLLANNMRDISYDARLKVKTLSIMLGSRWSFLLYAALMLLAYLYVLGLVVVGILSLWGLLVLLSLPRAFALLKSFRAEIPNAADAVTAKLETGFGLLIIFALMLSRIAPI
jgi:1,4-dihydroxy-2-naphthoate octaprenyltransferase